MPGLVPGIHVLNLTKSKKTWMAGTSPAMTAMQMSPELAFIVEGALASLPINAATIFLGLTYVVLAQRHGALLSCLSAVAVWLALATVIRSVQWSLAGGLIANAIAYAICVPLLARY